MSEEKAIRYRILRWFRNLADVVARTKQFQMENVKDKGIERGMQVAAGTIGFGNIGDRHPVNEKNLLAYQDLLLMWKAWSKYLSVGEIEPLTNLLEAGEVGLFARSHRGLSVLGPVADAVDEILEALRGGGPEPEEEEGEE